MSEAYLEMLDDLLGRGLAGFGRGFLDLQAAYVGAAQQEDGGFCGRRGSSDTYYTDFALRLLLALQPAEPVGSTPPPRVLQRAGGFVGSTVPPRDAVECFSVLNAARLLGKAGPAPALPREAIAATLDARRLPTGGYGRPGGVHTSAYHTFLAALCLQMLDRPFPDTPQAVRAISALQGAGGGFREQDDLALEQTNATAAALGFLTLTEALRPEQVSAAVRSLGRMQAPDGGLRAHAEAHGGDLLSTFTGLLTLAGLDGLAGLDLGAAGRFVKSCARPGGGFGASPLDPAADVEYTYYGMACLALLRMAL